MAFIFPLNSEAVSAKLDWNEYWVLHRQVATICGAHVDHLLAIHGVLHLPEDLEEIEVQAILPQLYGDARHGDGQIMALVDVEYHGGAYVNPVITDRRSRLIPRMVTRHGLLHFLNLDNRCQTRHGRCIVWLNNVIWREQDQRIKNLRHGDFLRCAVPPKSEECEQDEVAVQSTSDMEDQVNLMQTRVDLVHGTPTSSSVPTRFVLLYLYGRDIIDVETVDATIDEVVDGRIGRYRETSSPDSMKSEIPP